MVRSPARTRAILTLGPAAPGDRPRLLATRRGALRRRVRRPDGLRLRVQPVRRRRLDRRPAGGRPSLAGRGQGGPARRRPATSVDIYGSELCVVLAGLAVDRPEVRDAAGLTDLVACARRGDARSGPWWPKTCAIPSGTRLTERAMDGRRGRDRRAGGRRSATITTRQRWSAGRRSSASRPASSIRPGWC